MFTCRLDYIFTLGTDPLGCSPFRARLSSTLLASHASCQVVASNLLSLVVEPSTVPTMVLDVLENYASSYIINYVLKKFLMVPEKGLEPSQLMLQESRSCMSTHSTIPANIEYVIYLFFTGFGDTALGC